MNWIVVDHRGRTVATFTDLSVREAIARFRAGGYHGSTERYGLYVAPATVGGAL